MSKPKRFRLGSSAVGRNLAEYLARAGYPLHADCGGKGTCGKCRVKLEGGYLYENPECTRLATPDKDGYVLACRVWGCSGGIISLPEQDGDGLTDFAGLTAQQKTAKAPSGIEPGVAPGIAPGIALDIGTTTLALALVDLNTGAVLSTASALNPQAAFGADVISRIDACARDTSALNTMQALLTDRVRTLMHDLTGGKRVLRMTVAGNTTMLHILCGTSPAGMGVYPFTPAFTEAKTLTGADLGLDADTVILLPSISAFVGGDLTAGMLACDLTNCDEPAMLMDVGTNGETVLYTGRAHGDRLLAASAAAGPALEGAGISSGMGGVRGAVSSVTLQKGKFVCRTVQDAPPVGICGSGLIDLVSLLYEHGHMDETGLLMAGKPFAYATGEHGALTLTQEDIRALQLCKSALRAGFEALCARAGLTPADVDRVYLAGGLGYYMNVDNAIAIGLLPEEVRGRVHSVGNTALGGAVRLLTDPDLLAEATTRAARCTVQELSTDPVWNDAFMEHMLFPE